jgi:hypothetical protein
MTFRNEMLMIKTEVFTAGLLGFIAWLAGAMINNEHLAMIGGTLIGAFLGGFVGARMSKPVGLSGGPRAHVLLCTAI